VRVIASDYYGLCPVWLVKDLLDFSTDVVASQLHKINLLNQLLRVKYNVVYFWLLDCAMGGFYHRHG